MRMKFEVTYKYRGVIRSDWFYTEKDASDFIQRITANGAIAISLKMVPYQ